MFVLDKWRPTQRLICGALLLTRCIGLDAGCVHVPTTEIAPGVDMPVISIGTGGIERKDAAVIVKSWLSLRGRGIDTAQIYGNMEVVAEALAVSGVDRSEVFITSKVRGCEDVEQNVQEVLKGLGTDYVDLMLIHFPSMKNCSAAWKILEDFHYAGSLRTIGVSNFGKVDLEPVLQTARIVPAVNQIELNVLQYDEEMVSFSEAHNIAIEAYSPLGRSGQQGNIPGSKAIQNIAAAHNVTTYQVALRWILQHGSMLTFQSTSRAHQLSDADVFNFSLTNGEMEQLNTLHNNPASGWNRIPDKFVHI